MRVVREVIDDAEVAVLAELSAAGHIRQAWGAAPRAIGSSIGVVLNAATTEAFAAAAALFDSPALSPFGHSGDAPGLHYAPAAAPPSFVGGAVPPMPVVPIAPRSAQDPPAGGADRFGSAGGSPPRMPSAWAPGATPGMARRASQNSFGSRPASPGGTHSPAAVAPLPSALNRPPSGSGTPAMVRRGSSAASLGTMSRSASASLLDRVASVASLAPGAPGQLRRVLAVDDEPVNLALVRRFLEREGVEVILGEDGHDLVDIMVKRGERFDVVLLDEHMRRMNGSPAAVLLRKCVCLVVLRGCRRHPILTPCFPVCSYEAEHGLAPTAVLAQMIRWPSRSMASSAFGTLYSSTTPATRLPLRIGI
jgi:CheY-like chemotaxis protein